MPYKDLSSIPNGLAGIKPPITLEQANEIAAQADAIPESEGVSPWGAAINSFKKRYKPNPSGDGWVKRTEEAETPEPDAEPEPVAEAATYKAAAMRLARDMAALLADRTVPAPLRKEVEDVRAMLRRTWADLEAEANGTERPTREEPEDEDEGEMEEGANPLLERTYVTLAGHKLVSLADCVRAYEASLAPVAEAKPEPAIITPEAIIDPRPTPDKAREWATQLGALLAEVTTYLREQAQSEPEPTPDVRSEPIAEAATPGEGDQTSDPTAADVPAPVAESIKYEETSEQEVQLSETAIAEDASGHVLELAEAMPQAWDGQGPLKLRTVLIEAGPGNSRDRHYYPAEMLQRCAPLFEGKKMYATDHKDSEKSVRTEVADILKCPAGYTDKGGIIAEVGIFDPDFARKAWNRAQMGTLQNLAVSIVGAGKTRRGVVDGQSYDVVTDITEGAADWVTAAGAGGRALAIAETAQPSAPEEETTHMLEKDKVAEILKARSGVTEAMAARLGEREYKSAEAVEAAVVAELDYIAEAAGAGKPTGLAESAQPATPAHKGRSAEEHDAAMQALMKRWGYSG
jgi:hypothetical protein